ncbi:MAG: IPT/TIG domain-containing protein [Anaerolineaceae bacterium]|nr:IPT/TIG domain-containing protein [Anaerolineaceae bacterium]
MQRTISMKWIITVLTGGFLLALAMAGGNWKVSYAGTITTPTVPTINTMQPNWVLAGKTTDTLVTITGKNFIPQTGGPWTLVRLTVQGQTSPVSDIIPTSITASELKFILHPVLVDVPIVYEVTVVNHPAAADTQEISAKMLFFVSSGKTYLPLVFN